MKKTMIFLMLCTSPLMLSGCWDRTELNDLAFKMGLAMDVTENGMTKATAQIAVPSQLGGSAGASQEGSGGGGQGYIVVSGTGRNTREAVQDMQTKISRRITAGQRRGIFVSEELAQKRGLGDVIDANTRDPDTRLRTDIFMVKGGQAEDVLKVYYPFEQMPVLAAVKIHKVIGGTADTSFRDFLSTLYDDSSSPTLPIIQITQEGERELFQFGGRAVFNKDMKFVGAMDARQSVDRLWVTNQIQRFTLTEKMPEHEGTVSLELSHMKAKIQSYVQGNTPSFIITLKGVGGIRESDISIDLTKPDQLQHVKAILEDAESRQALDTIHAMQNLDADVFCLGQSLHKQHPGYWKRVKGNWQTIYPECKVTVRADLTMKRIGLTGSFLEGTGAVDKS